MNRGIVTELQREAWAMEPRALEALLARVADLSAKLDPSFAKAAADRFTAEQLHSVAGQDPVSWIFDEDQPKKTRMGIQGGVATIPITGVLMKSVPKIFRWFGIDATSYRDIQNDLAQAVGDESVKSITLLVDSPGGQVAGVKDAADAIMAAGQAKPVSAQIEDIGASGAYWLASQAKKVTASQNAMIGSIGVYSAYVDSSQAAANEGYKVHVVSSGPHKGMGIPGAPITEEQLGAMQEVIDGMAANFVSDVARGRGRGEAGVKEWASGRVWIAADAAKLGLIDSVANTKGTTRAGGPPAASIEPLKEGETMADTTKAAAGVEAQAVTEKAVADARTAERTRLQDLKAAFPKDQPFAFEQFEKGASVQEAKVAYCDVLQARQAELQKENGDLKKAATERKEPETKPVGARPVPAGEEASTQAGPDFLARAAEVAKERGCSMRQALSHVARTEPAVYERHMQSVGAGGILERRRVADAEKARGR